MTLKVTLRGINGRYRLTECPRHRQFQPLVQWFLHSICVPFLVRVLHYLMHSSSMRLLLAGMYNGMVACAVACCVSCRT